jgi:hypothetical protein
MKPYYDFIINTVESLNLCLEFSVYSLYLRTTVSYSFPFLSRSLTLCARVCEAVFNMGLTVCLYYTDLLWSTSQQVHAPMERLRLKRGVLVLEHCHAYSM